MEESYVVLVYPTTLCGLLKRRPSRNFLVLSLTFKVKIEKEDFFFKIPAHEIKLVCYNKSEDSRD